jgi:putative long chain acyl-CoA synthase
VEFYAPIEGEAVLANVAAHKPGAMGRPLPGSAPIRIAAYDIAKQSLLYRDDGLVQECSAGEVGMLLVGVHPAEAVADAPMRGVFRSGDAWRQTGDLFWRDPDGDHWLAGPASTVIRGPGGLVLPSLVDDALRVLPSVDVAVTYAVATGPDRPPLSVSAVRLLTGAEVFRAEDLDEALGATLERTAPPDVVRVVEDIPVTDWYRPRPGHLVGEGLQAGPGRAWVRDRDGKYVPLTADACELLAER